MLFLDLFFKKYLELHEAGLDNDSYSDPACLPVEGESVAISISPKTAALCYDRVWSFSERCVPRDIRCFGGTCLERGLAGMRLDNVMSDRPISHMQLLSSFDLPAVAQVFSFKCGIPMIPIFSIVTPLESVYRSGDHQVIVATLTDLNIVSEDALTWEQVLEFRKDKESQYKYKRLLHWLDKEMIGKSQNFIKEDIELRLHDYEHALKKHGVKTVLGTISEALDGKYVLGASGMAGSLILSGYPNLGVLVGSGLIIGKTVVKLAQTLLDFDDVQCGLNSEISWFHEVKRLKVNN